MRPSQPCNTTCAAARDLSRRAMVALGPRRTGEWPLGKRTRPATTAKPEARRHHADYDEAVRLQPRQAMSLYARGVAKAKKGSPADGQADKQAALALNGRIADQARRYGVDSDGPPTP